MSDGFDLPGLVLEVLHSSSENDPRVLAVEVMEAIPKAHQNEALVLALAPYVQRMMARDRPHVTTLVKHAQKQTALGKPVGWSAFVSDVQKNPMWQSRYAIANGQYKKLKDLTAEDLGVLASRARLDSITLRIKAEGFERLKKLMENKNANVVGDLSQTEVLDALGGVGEVE